MSRGRGAGRAGSTFSLESMGFGRGDPLPQPVLQPPPTFPPLGVELPSSEPTEDDIYLIELSRSLKDVIRGSKHYVKESKEEKSIVKYSDKYESMNEAVVDEQEMSWDLRLFPKELHTNQRLSNVKRVRVDVSPTLKHSRLLYTDEVQNETGVEVVEVTVKQEVVSDEEKDPEEEMIEDEDLNEEDTDYQNAYFDNGEDYLDVAGSDDNDNEGPTY